MRYRQGKPFWFQTLQILLILLILPLPSFSYVEPFQVPSIYWHDTNSNFMAWLFTKASIRVLRAAHALVGASIRVCVSLSNLLTKRFIAFFFWFSLYSLSIYLPHLNTTASKRSTCRDRTCHLQPLRLLGCLCFWIFCDPVLLAIEE